MVIKDVKVTPSKDSITVSASCRLRKVGWDKIYITLEGKNHHDYIFGDASPFAAALLIPSMKQGEDLIIHGSISEQLYNGMQEAMKLVLSWDLGFKPIQVKADTLTKDTQTANTHTASAFSGGVDSFYTYLKHKKDQKKTDRVDSFILVKGFDVDLRNKELWKTTLKNVQTIAKKEGIELLTVETNARVIMDPILPRGDFSHGGCLAAIGLVLRNGLRKMYIPSSFSVAEQVPWGSHMDLDPNWSTEKLTFVHDGTEATRLEKILLEVSKSPIALEHLRVCYMNEKGKYNCGLCDKCIRTMTSFYIAGTLEQVKTFPNKINLERAAEVMHVTGDNRGKFITWGEEQNLTMLKERNIGPELQKAITERLEKTAKARIGMGGRLKFAYADFYQKVVYLDFAYTNSTLYDGLASMFGRKF